jgi:hypothetical protein
MGAAPATVSSDTAPVFRNASRIAYASFAVLGTFAYSESFRAVGVLMGKLAAMIGLSAGLSWIGFGALLALCTRHRISVQAWFDACLRTMVIGNGVLLVTVILNIGRSVEAGPSPLPVLCEAWGWILAHGAVLLAADGLMCRKFVAEALALSVGRGRALLLWVGGLHGFFALSLWTLNRGMS